MVPSRKRIESVAFALNREEIHSLSDKEKLERLQFALEGTQLGIWDWDLVHHSVQFDRRWCDIVGLDIDQVEMTLKTWESRVHPEDLIVVQRDMQDYLDGKTPFYENIHRMRHADGRWIYVLDRGRISERDAFGKPLRLTGTHLDISVSEEVRRVLQARESLFRTVVQSLPASVAMFDLELKYLACSDAWLEQYGLERAKILGRGHYDIFPEIPDRWKKIHTDCLAGARRVSEFDVFERGDGRKQYLRWVVEPWRDSSGEIGGLLMLTEDLTETVETRERLEHASRLSELGEMAGGIAHEINNPLAIITGFCERIRDRYREGDPTRENIMRDVEKIQAGVERISKIVVSMRSLAREPTSRDLRSVSLGGVLREVLDLCRERFKAHGVEFIVDETSGDNISVHAEPTGLSQILINLLNNAFYAVARMKHKSIELDVRYASAPGAEGWVEIRVRDSGPGVPKDLEKNIFAPFFTTKEPGEGTGLGLSLSQSIAARFGGSLQLIQPGTGALPGAEFLLRLKRGR